MEDKKIFNKLVRDNIIEKITNNGEFVSYRVLDDIEYKRELLNKLKEECNEVIDAFTYGQSGDMVIELADVLEVLNYLAKSINVNMQEVNDVAMMKKAKNGGFDKKYYRSEEHTSELQSRGHLVCRLLLEKKKKIKNKKIKKKNNTNK